MSYRVVTYTQGIPAHSEPGTAQMALEVMRAALRKGQYVEAYNESGIFIPMPLLAAEAECWRSVRPAEGAAREHHPPK